MTRSSIGIALAFLVAGMSGFIDHAARADDDAHERSSLSGTHAKQQFLSGSEVVIDATVNDDVFAAGGDVDVRRLEAEDMIVAGGVLDLRGLSLTDLIVAGGNVDIAGEIADDVLAVGGKIDIDRDTVIAGDVMISGGRLVIAGTIGGEIRAAGGNVSIDAVVDGDVTVAAGRLTLGSGSILNGRLVFYGSEAPEIAEGAVIRGGVEFVEAPVEIEAIEKETIILAAVVAVIGVLIALLVYGAVMLGAFPAVIGDGVRHARDRPWPCLAIGFAILFAVPAAIGLVFATVVAIPVALFAMALYATALGFAVVVGNAAVGDRLFGRYGLDFAAYGYWRRFARFALGATVVAVIGIIPFLGWLVVVLVLSMGMGGISSVLWDRLRHDPGAI